ncbi:hypothetical protein DEO72_LG5g437 [Vigna unguiculata]|uniref:Malectin-like domain-containing protein n=1 Tax=Vigna unguiculata TaxID=3917 RepID=A0A4D6LUR7_VIGUN|nr:hypothetical protein DEO72_LG5g437 [Vigna unguiculata]
MKIPPESFVLGVALWVLLVSEPCLTVFVSIDCGSSQSSTDENNIRWIGDDDYIQHGESHQVYLGSNPLSTLRVFTDRKKNCYSIRVGKGEKILTRASFYYGNYDDKFSPPVFDLQFDGNYWATVNSSSYYYVDYEAIYVAKGNFTSICVAQTKPNQFPFISSLEVRSLDPTMYSHVDPNHALILQWRYAFGGNQTIRYPYDVFDRIWAPSYGIGLSEVKSEPSGIDTSTAEDHPPQAALENAIISSSTTQYMQFINRLSTKELPIYITAYFSEVNESAVGKRSIQMYIDNKPFLSPIVPPFGSVKEVFITNMTASAKTSFILQASETSTLPPVLNALEVYTLSDALTAGTDSRDVEGLLQLQLAFEVLVEWSGDPCLPYPYNWDWIQCNTDVKPRVTALYLTGYNLRGTLPDFSSMNALEIMNLSNNRFNGSIPTSLKHKSIELVTTNNCLSGMYCQPLSDSPSKVLPSPPPPPLGLQFVSSDEPLGGGTEKINNNLNMAFIVAMQTLLLLVNTAMHF